MSVHLRKTTMQHGTSSTDTQGLIDCGTTYQYTSSTIRTCMFLLFCIFFNWFFLFYLLVTWSLWDCLARKMNKQCKYCTVFLKRNFNAIPGERVLCSSRTTARHWRKNRRKGRSGKIIPDLWPVSWPRPSLFASMETHIAIVPFQYLPSYAWPAGRFPRGRDPWPRLWRGGPGPGLADSGHSSATGPRASVGHCRWAGWCCCALFSDGPQSMQSNKWTNNQTTNHTNNETQISSPNSKHFSHLHAQKLINAPWHA
jgi:hypothetical protein